MLVAKLLLTLVVILIVTWVFGLFGPGPLIPGLGPMFDQLPALLVGFCLVLTIPLLVRKLMLRGKGESAAICRTTPEEILRERYASGEVNREEFYRIAEELRSRSPQGF